MNFHSKCSLQNVLKTVIPTSLSECDIIFNCTILMWWKIMWCCLFWGGAWWHSCL